MKLLRKFRFPLFAIALIAVLLYVGKFGMPKFSSDSPHASDSSSQPAQARNNITPLSDPLPEVFRSLAKSSDASLSRNRLANLQAQLASLPADQAAAWILAFLASGQDKLTGLSFEINADGTLKEWPTFRTFLLDTLLAIDPAAAATLAREILATPTSADEWALALRNLGKVESTPETNRYLRERTETLINHPDWQENPSIGYLNAFDVLVHTNAIESTPLLSNLIQRKDRKDLAHAGFLTLDRLVQKSPTDVLSRLAADAALQQSRPEMTAQQFARADLRDPAQQAIVKSWLLDPSRTGIELRAFAGVYPNNNHFVSHNLLTTDPAPTGADLAAHDRHALAIIQSWSGDPAFQRLDEHLRTMISRLTQFTKSQQ